MGWSLIDDTCYTYIGSHSTYQEAEAVCARLDSRIARETIAPIKLPRFRKLARLSQFNYETQSYRRMWLYTDVIRSGVCSIVEDLGVSSANCNGALPFVCEKDPMFRGANFRFKDEVAFAIAATGALLLFVVLLSLLWVCKSRKRKKEHIDRQNTLRSSARTHRHMMASSSNFSTMNKSTSSLYNIGGSIDNLSSRFNHPRGLHGPIYSSQRNQYFSSKKHKTPVKDAKKSSNDFSSSGLDNRGDIISDGSIKYHMYDPGIPNNSVKFYSEEENADITTTESLSDRQNQNQDQDSSFKTNDTFTENSYRNNLQQGKSNNKCFT